MTTQAMTSPAATDEAPLHIEIVPASGESLAYVLSNWGRTLDGAASTGHLSGLVDFLRSRDPHAGPGHGFLKALAPIQAKIIKRSKVLTALHAGRIAGFIVYEPSTLHWIQTRKEYRQKHVAGRLLERAGCMSKHTDVSAWTPDLRHVGLADAPFTPFWVRAL